jgi:hypothetical protein
MSLITIDFDSPNEVYEQLLTLNVGDVFKYKKDSLSILRRVQEMLPLNGVNSFLFRDVTPGTSLFTIYGPNTLVVIHKEEDGYTSTFDETFDETFG